MSKLEKAKEIIKENYKRAQCGIFNRRNAANDVMKNIYEGDGLTIDICYEWEYFEVFGLSQNEFLALVKYYYELEEE